MKLAIEVLGQVGGIDQLPNLLGMAVIVLKKTVRLSVHELKMSSKTKDAFCCAFCQFRFIFRGYIRRIKSITCATYILYIILARCCQILTEISKMFAPYFPLPKQDLPPRYNDTAVLGSIISPGGVPDRKNKSNSVLSDEPSCLLSALSDSWDQSAIPFRR